MASQKLVFMVTLMLVFTLGCHAQTTSKKCNSSDDCPACGLGLKMYVDGVCTCIPNNQQLEVDAVSNCELAVDCPPCRIGFRQCVDGVCSCIPTNQQHGKQERKCEYDTDCVAGCDPKCYHFCEDSTCYCECGGK